MTTAEPIAEALGIDVTDDGVTVIEPGKMQDTLRVYTPNLIIGVDGRAAATRVADVLLRSLPGSTELRIVRKYEAGYEVQTETLDRLRVIDIDVSTAVFVEAVDARVEAMSALYAADVMKQDTIDVTNLSKRAATLAAGTWEHRELIDQAIGSVAEGWRTERMAVVDRNVLRLGTFELLHTDLARGVILDEAVELAKAYSTSRSPAFVNGVLDAIADGRESTSV